MYVHFNFFLFEKGSIPLFIQNQTNPNSTSARFVPLDILCQQVQWRSSPGLGLRHRKQSESLPLCQQRNRVYHKRDGCLPGPYCGYSILASPGKKIVLAKKWFPSFLL